MAELGWGQGGGGGGGGEINRGSNRRKRVREIRHT